MLGRLIMKSILAICIITTLIASIARAQSTERMSLSQIQNLPREINQLLNDRDYSDSEKSDLIAKSRYDVELSIRTLMMAGIILPKDLANPRSSAAKAMQVADNLVILDQLKVENGQFTGSSCIEARGMLSIANTNVQRDVVELDRKEERLLDLINKLCR